MANRLTGAEAFIECLKAEGVEFVFGVPGGQTLAIMNVLFDTPEIRFVTARHECAATHMADAYGRATGRPGIALATTGPGATNMLTAVGGALRDSSPAIIVTCNNRRRHIGTDDNQDADHLPLFQQFTKHCRFVPDAEAVPHATREAFRIALTGNPGPVHLDFARDSLEGDKFEFVPMSPSAYRPTTRVAGDQAEIEAIFGELASASRPVIWVGKGVINADAGDAVMALARALGVPVVTTYNGIGAVPGSDPLVVGPHSRFGTVLSRGVLKGADCILLVGNSMNAASTLRWTLPLTERLLHVDVDPQVIGRHYPVARSAVADARWAMERLTALAAAGGADARAKDRKAWLARLEDDRAAWRGKVFPDGDASVYPIKPQWVMREAARVLTADDIVVADAGNPGIWTHLLPIDKSRHYMKPVGFGNMAFGLPAAIAAKLARPQKRVAAFVGDGSLGMCLGEIETAVREKTAFALVVMNDRAYGNIRQEEFHYFGQRYIGVDFTDVKYADVARAMGADGERVTRPEEFAPVLERALAADGPFLIDVLIDGAENVWKDPI